MLGYDRKRLTVLQYTTRIGGVFRSISFAMYWRVRRQKVFRRKIEIWQWPVVSRGKIEAPRAKMSCEMSRMKFS